MDPTRGVLFSPGQGLLLAILSTVRYHSRVSISKETLNDAVKWGRHEEGVRGKFDSQRHAGTAPLGEGGRWCDLGRESKDQIRLNQHSDEVSPATSNPLARHTLGVS